MLNVLEQGILALQLKKKKKKSFIGWYMEELKVKSVGKQQQRTFAS